MIVTYKLMLNAEKGGYQAVVDGIKTGDLNTRELYITLSDGGRPLILPENAIATIFGEKEDGTVFFASCEILDDFVIKHVIKTSEINVIGEIKCECRVTSKDKVITSPKFRMIVTDILQDDEAIESQDEFTALTDALARTERAVDEAEQAVNEAQIAVDDARSAALSAENAVSIAGDAVRLADSVTAKATEAANNAKEAAENANNAVKNANDALYRAENAETGLGSKLDKVAGTEGNLVVFGPDKTIKDGGKPSKVYTVPYYDNATDEQKAEIKAAIEAMKADSGVYNVLMVLNGGQGYSIPAQALITPGTSTIVAVFRASTDTSYIVQHNIQLTGAGTVRCWSEEVAGGGGGGGGVAVETDPTVPDWAKSPTKPTYTAEEVGALPADTVIPTVPTKVSAFTNDKGYLTEESDPTVPSWAKQPTKPSYTKSEVGLGNVDNVKQYSASNPPPYPVASVNGKTGAVSLSASDVKALPDTYTPPDQTAAQVGADAKGTAEAKVSAHNTSDAAHNDIRLLISGLTTRLNALADSTDTDLDQLSEIVAYIKSNKSLIDGITTNKVNVSDIINNLTTNVSNKPLSAAQGVALKALIDAITVPTKLSQLAGDSTHRVVTDAEKTAWNAKSNFSGAYNDLTGKPTIPTVPTKISAFENDKGYLTSVPSEYVTETELANKKYLTSVPSEYITETELSAKGYLTQHQDISGKANKSDAEAWTFTLKSGSTVTKKVVLA